MLMAVVTDYGDNGDGANGNDRGGGGDGDHGDGAGGVVDCDMVGGR